MVSFMDAALGFPTVVLSALLGVAVVYWLLALVGVVDIDHGDVHIDLNHELQADAHIDDLGTLAGFIVAFGLNGVPISVVVTLLLLAAWTISCMADMWLLPLVPTLPLQVAAGAAVLAASLALAIPITARAIRPLRGLFVTHAAISNAALVGQSCRVITQTVNERFGRAEVAQRGANINIRVWAHSPNGLSKGHAALILEYDAGAQRYLIEAAPP